MPCMRLDLDWRLIGLLSRMNGPRSQARHRISCISALVVLAQLQSVLSPIFALRPLSVSPATFEQPALDSGHIAFIRDGNLWLIRADGAEERQLTFDGGYSSPAWSPDGSALVFIRAIEGQSPASGLSEIGLIDLATLEVQHLVQPEETPFALETTFYRYQTPVWSPEGEEIFFVASDGRASGSSIRGVRLSDGSWSPAPDVTVSGRFGPFFDVLPTDLTVAHTVWTAEEYVLGTSEPDGSHEQRLHRSSAYLGDLCWLPDGSRLAFVTSGSQEPGSMAIELLSLSTRARNGVFAASDIREIACSPDGSAIAYDSEGVLYVLDLESGQSQHLTKGSEPAWVLLVAQADVEGTIAYVGDDQRIWVVAPDGSAQRQLVPDTTSLPPHLHELTWSPDGEDLMFLSPSDTVANASAVWLVEKNGSNLRKVSDAAFHDGPVWSPSGDLIAYVGPGVPQIIPSPDEMGMITAEIYLLNPTTGEAEILTGSTGLKKALAWSPNETTIAFNGIDMSFYPDEVRWSLFLLDLGTLEERWLSEMPDAASLTWSPDGRSVVFAHPSEQQLKLVDPMSGVPTSVDMPFAAPMFGANPWSHDGTDLLLLCEYLQVICTSEWPGGTWFQVWSTNVRELINQYPSWSPDGSMITFSQGGSVYVVGADGANPRPIASGSFPTWQPARAPPPSADQETFGELIAAKRETIDFLLAPDFGSIDLPAFRSAGYDETQALALINEVALSFDAGNLGPSQASGFLRMKLQEDVLLESYVAYLITVDDLNDTTVSLFDIVFDLITLARSVTKPLGLLGEEILEKIVEKLSDLLNDWIQAHEGISPIWRTTATVILDQMEGDIDVTSVGGEAFRLELDRRLTSDYVQRTQPIIDRAVTSATDPGTFSGSDDAQAVHDVDQRLATLREDIDRRHEILTWAKDFLDDYVSASYPLVPTAVGRLVIAVNELIAAVTELHLQTDATLKSLRDIQSVLGDSQRLLFPHADVAALVDGPPSAPHVEPRQLAVPGDLYMLASARLPDQASGGTLHADPTREQAIEGYQQVLQELMRAIGEGDHSTVEDLVPRLNSSERTLAAEFRKTRARAIAEGDAEMAAAIYRAAAEYDLRTVNLYFALGTYLSGAEGAEIDGLAQTQAEAVLQAIERYAQEISTAKSRLATPPAGPIVVASTVEVTSSVRVDRPVSIKLTLANASELIAEDVTVRIFLQDQTAALEEIIGTLAGNEEATLDIELDVESGTNAGFVQVYSGGKLTDSRLILLAAPALEAGGGDDLPTTNLAHAAIVLVCVVAVVLCLGGATIWLLRKRA